MASPDLRAPIQEPHHPTFDSVVGAIADWITRYRRTLGLTSEFGDCDAAEVARMAQDLNIPPAELRALAANDEHSADLLLKMLVALKIDPEEVTRHDPGVMRDLERLCVACGHKRQCRHEFAQGTAAANHGAFCPNSFTLDALFEEMAAGGRH